MYRLILFTLALLLGAPQCSQHEEHQQGVNKRSEHVMGFSQDKTTHHFRLFSDGGDIAVAANDPSDKTTIDQIRMHLGHIAKMFAGGNFNAPMLIHDTTPPGVATMVRLKEDIRYDFSEGERGGHIRITTTNAQAVDAIHAFLLFQIIDHQTGDAPGIAEAPH